MKLVTLRSSIVAALVAVTVTPSVASAAPVATTDRGGDGAYQVLGRVFPDPQGACNQGPCSPQAQGNVPATTFLGYQEMLDGLKYMNSGSAANSKVWSRYLEVWTLDGKVGENEGDAAKTAGTDETKNFAGNNLGKWEFTPKAAFHSAGIPTLGAGRAHSDVVVVRVTDESVPDAGKQRVVLSLSIHGIERAGVEGGARAMEDFVTAATTGKLDKPILTTKGLKVAIPTFKQVLQKTIIYFTFPNPDGWRRGDVNDQDQNKGPGVFFQRYNGNGVDVNRDFPDIGFAFRPYSGLSEPESRAWSSAFKQIKTNGPFAAGDDLHGMLGADSFSFTLLPHGSHDFAKNERIRNAAQTINLVQQTALAWSPLIQPNDKSPGQCASGPLGDDCTPMYGQTWGSVYDTINYTTTGALGDYMDSNIGLGADGIDNEMAYSHLDKDIAFEPLIEQMHVDGNKGLIFAHIAQILNPSTFVFPAAGRKGYVPNLRVKRAASSAPVAPDGTVPQDEINASAMSAPVPDPGGPYAEAVYPFEVKRSATIFNGGMRIDVTGQNVQGIDPVAAEQAAGSHGHNLKIQCKGCDQHAGVKDTDGWVTVAQDYDQSPLYLQAGLTVAVNDPQPSHTGKDTAWRAVIDGGVSPSVNVHIEFTSGPASSDGNTGGDTPPRQAAYDVASTDFWKKLDPFTATGAGFETVDADKLATDASAQVPSELDTLVLTDQALPGFSYPVIAAVEAPKDGAFASKQQTVPCAYTDGLPHTPACGESFDFKIPAGMDKVTVVATPASGGDITLTIAKVEGSTETQIGGTSDGSGPETIVLTRPAAGDYRAYVDNFSSAPPSADWWKATTHYEAIGGGTRGETKYTDDEFATYISKLKTFVEGGGNLVLTDGAMQALPSLFSSIKQVDVSKATSYVGQVAFTTKATTSQEKTADGNTLADPLAKSVAAPGARFNSGLRRQTYEPTPVGFSIQSPGDGGDESHAIVWQVARKAFEAAGGRVVGIGNTSDPRASANAPDQVTLGELKIGKGVVRVLGALLPEPTEAFDHQEGLEPFAVTYTGYYLAQNLTDYCAPGHSCVAPKVSDTVGPPGSSAKACVASRGFRSAAVKGNGKGLTFSFKRSGNAPVHVDLFQVSKGRRVLHERLIARFASRKAISWNGKKSRLFAPTDGYYFARFKVKAPSGFAQYKRIALRRSHGVWSRQHSFFGTETCSLLRQSKLSRMVFGGSNGTTLSASYLLARSAPVTITVTRGKKTVLKVTRKHAPGRKTVHVTLKKGLSARGLYRVQIVAGTGKSAKRSTMFSRKI